MEIAEEFVVFKLGLISLEWSTALFVLFVFLLTVFLVNKLLFAPLLKTFDGREVIRSENEKEEFDIKKSTIRLDQNCDRHIREIKSEIVSYRVVLSEEAAQKAESIITKTKADTASKYKKSEERIEKIFAEEIETAQSFSEEISQLLLTKISR